MNTPVTPFRRASTVEEMLKLAASSDTQLPANGAPLMSTKRYGHEIGLSCAFRQWRAESHCRFVHGYALAVTFTFAAQDVDKCGWVVDFGGLKELKQMLVDTFDHKLLVAYDDPALELFTRMHTGALDGTRSVSPCADVVIVPATGCEAFARMIFDVSSQWLKDAGFAPRCWLVSVEVSEHGANSAICFG